MLGDEYVQMQPTRVNRGNNSHIYPTEVILPLGDISRINHSVKKYLTDFLIWKNSTNQTCKNLYLHAHVCMHDVPCPILCLVGHFRKLSPVSPFVVSAIHMPGRQCQTSSYAGRMWQNIQPLLDSHSGDAQIVYRKQTFQNCLFYRNLTLLITLI